LTPGTCFDSPEIANFEVPDHDQIQTSLVFKLSSDGFVEIPETLLYSGCYKRPLTPLPGRQEACFEYEKCSRKNGKECEPIMLPHLGPSQLHENASPSRSREDGKSEETLDKRNCVM
jgi:hypothetical protein